MLRRHPLYPSELRSRQHVEEYCNSCYSIVDWSLALASLRALRRSAALGMILNLLCEFLDFFRLFHHAERQHGCGVRLFHFRLQLRGKVEELFDVFLDVF